MAKTTTPKPDIRLIVDVSAHTDSFGRTLRLSVRPVIVAEDGKMTNPSFQPFNTNDGGEYDGLVIDGHMAEPFTTDFLIGDEPIKFDIHRVDVRRAESLVKTLRRLNKVLAKLNDEWGYSQDTAGVLSRIANAMGCKPSTAFGRKAGGSGWSYNDFEYRWMDVDALRMYLDNQIKDWKGE